MLQVTAAWREPPPDVKGSLSLAHPSTRKMPAFSVVRRMPPCLCSSLHVVRGKQGPNVVKISWELHIRTAPCCGPLFCSVERVADMAHRSAVITATTRVAPAALVAPLKSFAVSMSFTFACSSARRARTGVSSRAGHARRP